MQTFVASLPPALTRRALLRLLIVDPIQRAALAIRHAFTSIGGTELELLIHFLARPRVAGAG